MNHNKSQQSSKLKVELSQVQDQAEYQYQQQNYEKAIQLYTQAISINSNIPELYNSRSLACMKANKLQLALQDAQQSLKLDENFAKGYIRVIETYLELDRKDEALQIINKALNLFEKDKQELENLKGRVIKQMQLVPKSPKWEELREWLYKEGAHFDKLTVAQFSENYRGIMAKTNITKKDKILFIPLNKMITLQMGKQLPISKKILAKNIQLLSPKHTFLALYLLYEIKKQNSEWKPYIDLLPKQFLSFPMFFNKKDLQLFQGSPFLIMIHQKVMDLKRDYQCLCSQQPSFKTFTFQQFCWARTAVCSRIFGLTINGVKTDALVPFADMINHRIPKQSSWVFVQKQNGFVMQAIEDIQRGQQVFDSYGKKCNTRFLLNYGFVLDNNDMNEVPFKVMLDPKDPLLNLKLQMIGGQKSVARIYKVAALPPNDAVLYELFGFLRFRIISQQSILNALKTINNTGEGYAPSRTPPITRNLQIQCWNYIQQCSQYSLKNYPTTLQMDEQKLRQTDLQQNARNSLILLRGQKRLYKHFSSMASHMKFLLSKTKQQFKKQFMKPQYIPHRDYIQKVLIPLIVRE